MSFPIWNQAHGSPRLRREALNSGLEERRLGRGVGNHGFRPDDVPVAAQSGVVAIAAGGDHTVALKSNGSVVAWGVNNSGQRTVPVAAKSGVTAIAAGGSHTVALKTNGAVVAWGADNFSWPD